MKPNGPRLAAAAGILSGALSALLGWRALSGGAATEVAVGAAVPFELCFNVLSGFAFVAAGVGILLRGSSVRWLAESIPAVFALAGLHVAQARAFDLRTVGVMIPRAGIWVAIANDMPRSRAALGRPA